MNNLPNLPSVTMLRGKTPGIGILSRRSFLLYSGVSLMALSLFRSPDALASLTQPDLKAEEQFRRLCEFLTAKELDLSLTSQAFSALTKVDAKFNDKAASLADFIRNNKVVDIEALKAFPSFTAGIRETALNIIGSLYMGYAGTPRPGQAEDDTQFVTYTQALMYRLTYEFTPIPSYSRWSTGYWSTLPKQG